jgi:hypothetical protein
MAARARKGPNAVVVIVVFVVVVACFVIGELVCAHSSTGLAFDGSSDELKATVIVPTLDTPMPEGKNVIWCGAFQLAWDQFRDRMVGEPVVLSGSEQDAERLNSGRASPDDFPSGCPHYASAGRAGHGTVQEIQEHMASSFPDEPRPKIKAARNTIVLFSYNAISPGLSLPFNENSGTLLFQTVPVRSFGIRKEDSYPYGEPRDQVKILYLSSQDAEADAVGGQHDHRDEFAIAPCGDESEIQIILACIEPKATLAETIADLDRKIADWRGKAQERLFGMDDVLLIPRVTWFIRHRFTELEGREIANKGCPLAGTRIGSASQMIDFSLKQSGVMVSPRAESPSEDTGRHFVFDRPFLVVMKKRGAERPFFVMWVDNPELLCRR